MIFKKPTRDQVVALAGLFQACQLVEQLARNGTVPSDRFGTCIHSIFQQNPDNVEQVYGSLAELHTGIETTHQLLTIQPGGKASDALRYAVGVTHLQSRLMRDRKMLDQLSQGIDRAHSQAQYFSGGESVADNEAPEEAIPVSRSMESHNLQIHENVIASLADLYQNTLSTFRYRIQVNGYANHLQQVSIANRIRALLLAGVRSAVLWRQLGGTRWHLILYRKEIIKLINSLQSEL